MTALSSLVVAVIGSTRVVEVETSAETLATPVSLVMTTTRTASLSSVNASVSARTFTSKVGLEPAARVMLVLALLIQVVPPSMLYW